jgi:hypothetical protein
MGPIDEHRRVLLGEFSDTNPSTEEFVLSLVEPLANATVRSRHSCYARFLARSHTDPLWASAVERSGFGEAYRRWRSLLYDHLDAIPDALRNPRIDRAVTTAILGLARLEERRLPIRQRETRDRRPRRLHRRNPRRARLAEDPETPHRRTDTDIPHQRNASPLDLSRLRSTIRSIQARRLRCTARARRRGDPPATSAQVDSHRRAVPTRCSTVMATRPAIIQNHVIAAVGNARIRV